MLLLALGAAFAADPVAPAADPVAATGRPLEIHPYGRVYFRPEVAFNTTDYSADNEDSGWIFTLRTNLGVDVALPKNVHAVMDLMSHGTYAIDLGTDAGVGAPGTGGAPLNPSIRLYQGYFEIRDIGGTPLDLLGGRMEIGTLGTGMLVSSDDFNDGFSLESARLQWNTDKVELSAQWAQLYSDLDPDPANEDWINPNLAGTHDTVRFAPEISVDAYFWWVVSHPFAGFVTQTHATGVRPFGVVGGLDYSAEAALQFGTAKTIADGTPADVLAYAVEPRVGYTVGRVRFGGVYYRASGDGDAADKKLNTWNILWQDPHGRFGNLDRFTGSNLQSERIEVQAELAGGDAPSTLSADVYALQAVAAGDPHHKAFPVAPATDAGTALGIGGDVTYRYPFSPHMAFDFNLSAFKPGEYADETMGSGDALVRFYVMADARF